MLTSNDDFAREREMRRRCSQAESLRIPAIGRRNRDNGRGLITADVGSKHCKGNPNRGGNGEGISRFRAEGKRHQLEEL